MNETEAETMKRELTARFARSAGVREAKVAAWLAELPASLPCEWHPGKVRVLDRDASETASLYAQRAVGIHLPCPVCAVETQFRVDTQRLRKAGVPDRLLHCSLANWKPEDAAGEAVLAKVREYSVAPRGRFLILFGSVGSGKSHLATGVLRAASGLFRTQARLLRQLRDSYNDDEVRNPINECQDAKLFVLDDVGLSGGGRDEGPMIYEILSYRADMARPTILTCNGVPEAMWSFLGERLYDRVRGSDPLVVILTGTSHRGAGASAVPVPAAAWNIGGGQWTRDRGPRRDEFAGDAAGEDLWRSLDEAWREWKNNSPAR